MTTDTAFNRAFLDIKQNALEHSSKKPAMTTLIEEVAEAVLSARGKHNDPLELEITQIGGVCINILAQLYAGNHNHVKNI